MGTYVDDNACIGTMHLIKESIDQLQEVGFMLKVMEDFTDYCLSCEEIIFLKDKTKAWRGQPHLLRKLKNKFGRLVMKELSSYKTPGTPGHNIMRSPINIEKIGTENATSTEAEWEYCFVLRNIQDQKL